MMAYAHKLTAAIKANGKILRDFDGTTYLPFGSEYKIVLKNLNTVRVLINITLDGDEVCPDGLVLNPGQSVELERWIKNGNLTTGNCFKFIERSSQIEQHRGIKLEDGLIRIEFQFESPRQYISTPYTPPQPYWGGLTYPPGVRSIGSTNNVHDGMPCANINSILRSEFNISATAQNCSATLSSTPISAQSAVCNDVGITVPGSQSNQSFTTVSSFPVDPQKHCIVFKLLGETPDNKPVETPVTVKTKAKCDTCGTTNKMVSKFCTECGTALTVW
jgi:hypothetical protein